MNFFKYGILISSLFGFLFMEQAYSQMRPGRNAIQIHGSAGLISINPTLEEEVKKTGSVLGIQVDYESWFKRNSVIFGFGYKKTDASGEDSYRHQEFALHNPYLNLILKRAPQKGQVLSFGFWSQLVMGKVAGLKYYERDSFQFAPYVGGIIQYRMPQSNGSEILLSSGLLYEPNVGGVSSFIIPLMVGLSIPVGSSTEVALPAKTIVPAVVIPPPPPPPPVEPIRAELVVGSEILVFEVESDELRGNSQKFSNELAQILMTNARLWKEVEVVGYSSPIEEESVGLKRAEKVKQAMIAAGIPLGQIKVTPNKNKTYTQPVKGSPQRVDVVIIAPQNTDLTQLKNVVGPFQERWANYSYRFRHQALGFEINQFYLTKPAEKMILKIAQILKDKNSEWNQLVIYGFTDSIGKRDVNVKLAKKRAANVLNIFIKEGLDPSKMEALGMTDEAKSNAENPEEGPQDLQVANPEDRRVEIEIQGIKNREELNKLMDTLSGT